MPGLESAGKLDGQLTLEREAGNWTMAGDLGLLNVDATGSRLAGDQLRLDRVHGSWNVTASDGTWVIHRLDLNSPLGSIKASGQRPASAKAVAKVSGTLDLAALSKQLPHALRLRDGIVLERELGRRPDRVTGRSHRGKGKSQPGTSRRRSAISRRKIMSVISYFESRPPSPAGWRLRGKVRRRAVGRANGVPERDGAGDVDRGIEWSGTLDLGSLQVNCATCSTSAGSRWPARVSFRAAINEPSPNSRGV